MTIDELNGLPPEEAAALLRPCADIDSFVTALVSARPYGDLDQLLATARAQARDWTPAEVEGALAGHPRIGERPADPLAAREQAGVSREAGIQQRLRAGNTAYEQRFGRIYLVRAAGRTAEEMLDLLDQRLDHDPETELAVTRGQLGEIALLRLEGLFA